MSVTTFAYVGFVQVLPDGNTIKPLSSKWLTNLPPFEPADHVVSNRMIDAIFRANNVSGSANIYPEPGFYNVSARGHFEFGCDDDGGTMMPVFEYSGHQPVDERAMDNWFLNPQPIRPTFFNVIMPGERRDVVHGG